MLDKNFDFVGEGPATALLAQLPFSMVISDPTREDCPIVYVNRAFETITGYSARMALGKNCRFLQGEDRDQPARAEIREAIQNEKSVAVDIRNYRANGEPFLNRLIIAPVHDEDGKLFAFIGLQSELAETEEGRVMTVRDATDLLRETQHRVKNHLAMVASMIRLEAKNERPDRKVNVYDVLARRVDALSLLYDEFTQSSIVPGTKYDVVSSGGYISRISSTIAALEGRASIRTNIDVDTIPMRAKLAANLGLIVSEVLSNTFQHAFVGRKEGVVEVRLKSLGSDRIRLTISDDGVGMGDSDWPNTGNLGARIVRSIAKSLRAEISVNSTGLGTVFTLEMLSDLPTQIEQDGGRAALRKSG
ncbi:PAS domain-containing protein [Erythrobacter sp.]|jgi:PAS domain S-box-containing protein|uniref:PAS domain-containing protein n=1 Tax=Erythrobacter sp. TaxID=1042 RepID=UPI002ECC2FB7|nr:PAS domain-containing protein [Erythrobacter sp.]